MSPAEPRCATSSVKITFIVEAPYLIRGLKLKGCYGKRHDRKHAGALYCPCQFPLMLGTVSGNSAGNYFSAFGDEVPQCVVVFIGYIKVAVRAESADFALGIKWFSFLCSPFNQLDLLPVTVCSKGCELFGCMVTALLRFCCCCSGFGCLYKSFSRY